MPVLKALLGVVMAAMLVAGCAQSGSEKQTIGTLGGAALGGLAGSQIGGGTGKLAATAAGTLLGGFLGSSIGQSLDKADKAYASQTTQSALENGQSGVAQSWNNPDTNARGTVTPQAAYQNASGTYCRPFTQTIFVDGEQQSLEGTACRQPDGSWKIVG